MLKVKKTQLKLLSLPNVSKISQNVLDDEKILQILPKGTNLLISISGAADM